MMAAVSVFFFPFADITNQTKAKFSNYFIKIAPAVNQAWEVTESATWSPFFLLTIYFVNRVRRVYESRHLWWSIS